jgi:penicillin-binding protein 1C
MPAAPADVVAANVTFEPAVETPRREYFLRGTQMHEVRALGADASIAPTIRYPANDTIVALDPDIPAGHQRITFEADSSDNDLVWRLDAARIESLRGRAQWAPTPGRHELTLERSDGRVLSRIAFEVRGDPRGDAGASAATRSALAIVRSAASPRRRMHCDSPRPSMAYDPKL